jgi:hypothetical protein
MKEMDAKALAEKEDRLRRIYGNLPTRGNLVHHQLERKYFDSGDLALTAACKTSNIGKIQTGTEHPLVENISHPSAPVPSGSNVDDGANKNKAKGTNKTIHASQLGQEMKSDGGTQAPIDEKLESSGERNASIA